MVGKITKQRLSSGNLKILYVISDVKIKLKSVFRFPLEFFVALRLSTLKNLIFAAKFL